MNIPKPNNKEVQKYLDIWNNNEKWVLQDRCLNKLFLETYPNNTKIEEIIIKANTLNDFYSINNYYIIPTSKHILSLNIDERLKNGDTSLVADIADLTTDDKKIFLYSFAAKYCSFHNPNDFPLYDSMVEKALTYFQEIDRFCKSNEFNLKNYPLFKNILLEFAESYNINSYSLKQIDMYLWQVGKEYFSSNK